MRIISISSPGPAENLKIQEQPIPVPRDSELLVRVHAAGINRADILQRKGLYPPPPGASEILGLEISGEVVACGAQTSKFKVGDSVCGLLAGGGYAEYALLNEHLAFKFSDQISFEEAAGLPEIFLTAYQALFFLAKIQSKESVLIHAAASGVGCAAIQLAKHVGATVITTCSKGKLEFCSNFGATHTIDREDSDFAKQVLKLTQEKGVNIVLDLVGSSYAEQNFQALARDGRWIVIGMLGGAGTATLDFRTLLSKRLTLFGTTLRSRTLEYQAHLVKEFSQHFFPEVLSRKIEVPIAKVFPFEQVTEAHQALESNELCGKIILKIV